MKQLGTAILISLLASTSAFAQQQSNIGCIDKNIKLQAEGLKQNFTHQGMEVYKDATITLESQQPSPIAVQLKKGVMYQMIFVGSNDANRINFELFDGEDKKIGGRELRKGESNYVIFPFIPEVSDVYLIVLSQKVKGNETKCTSFTILQPAAPKKVEPAPVETPVTDNKANQKKANPQQTNPRYKGTSSQPKSQSPQQSNPRYVDPNKTKGK